MTPFPHTQNKKKTRKVCWNLVDWLWIKICWTSTHLNKNPWLQVVTIWPILQSQTRTKKIGTLLNPSWLQHAKNRTTTPSKPQHPQHSPARELSNGRWFRNSCGCTSCYAMFNIPIFMVGLIHARWLAGFLNRQHWQSKFNSATMYFQLEFEINPARCYGTERQDGFTQGNFAGWLIQSKLRFALNETLRLEVLMTRTLQVQRLRSTWCFHW